MDINTFLSSVPFVTGLLSIVYWTYILKPFIDRFADGEKMIGDDYTRLLTGLLGVAVSFAFPAASIPMTILQGATFAAIADGSYTKILARFKDEAVGDALPPVPTPVITETPPAT